MGSSYSRDRTIAGIILASGMSRRFGSDNKLLAKVGGEVVLRRTLRTYLTSGLSPVIVVVGHEAERVGAALAGLPIQLVLNPEFAEGQSRALVRGVETLRPETQAAVIGVGDQPLLAADNIQFLVDVYRQRRASIVVPRYAGLPGNPVLFDRSVFPELRAVTGDQGGRSVIRRHDDVVWVDVGAEPQIDIDTVDDLQRARWRDDTTPPCP